MFSYSDHEEIHRKNESPTVKINLKRILRFFVFIFNILLKFSSTFQFLPHKCPTDFFHFKVIFHEVYYFNYFTKFPNSDVTLFCSLKTININNDNCNNNKIQKSLAYLKNLIWIK